MTTNVLLRKRKLGRGSTNGISQASATGLSVVRNWVDPFAADTRLVFRWGCTSDVPENTVVVNKAKSIHWCSDKRQGRLDMQAAGVPVPMTWGTFQEYADHDYWRMPVVLRPARHAQGRNLFVYNPSDDLADADRLFAKVQQLGSYYISALIDKAAEYRVMVVQNRVVWVAQKTPGNPNQVAWNVAQGGRFDNVRWDSWPLAVVKAALKAAKVSGCDFCGVDVMVDAEGNPYVLEVNSAPSQTSPYRQSCVAKAFDMIVRNATDETISHYDDVPDGPRRTYKSYIHPALREPTE